MKKQTIYNYRSELMGIASIGVLIVHAIGQVEMSSMIKTICTFGQAGVFMFMLLSGMGLYESLNTRGGGVQQKGLLS